MFSLVSAQGVESDPSAPLDTCCHPQSTLPPPRGVLETWRLEDNSVAKVNLETSMPSDRLKTTIRSRLNIAAFSRQIETNCVDSEVMRTG